MSELGKGIATTAVCLMGAYCMYLTHGDQGIGWAFCSVIVIWCYG